MPKKPIAPKMKALFMGNAEKMIEKREAKVKKAAKKKIKKGC